MHHSTRSVIRRGRARVTGARSATEVLERASPRALTKMLGDVTASAAAVGLRYVTADEPGFHRCKRGRGFAIVDEHGRTVRRPSVLARVRALAIPPAWTDVWICKTDDGHLQAVGRDARGRKQYRYHAGFRAVRDAAKYEHLRDFHRALPGLRAKVQHDLACRCLCKEKVVATVVALIERAHLRVGNDEYTKANGSYGATTLLGRHARVHGSEVVLSYRGKGGKRRAIRFRDARIARAIRQCKSVPGARLFRWRDGRRTIAVRSADINAYLRERAGDAISAKDFRTWAATVAAAIGLAVEPPADSTRTRKRIAAKVIEGVALRLGNTPAVCRKSYVHPLLVERFLAGDLASPLAKLRRVSTPAALEQTVIAMLQ